MREQQATREEGKQPAISEHIRRNTQFFRRLKRCCGGSARHRYVAVIKGANSEQLLCLVECALNILRARLPLGPRHIKLLRRQAKGIRELSKARSARRARHLLLQQQSAKVQSGRGLPALAGLLASVLLPALVDQISERLKSTEA